MTFKSFSEAGALNVKPYIIIAVVKQKMETCQSEFIISRWFFIY